MDDFLFKVIDGQVEVVQSPFKYKLSEGLEKKFGATHNDVQNPQQIGQRKSPMEKPRAAFPTSGLVSVILFIDKKCEHFY